MLHHVHGGNSRVPNRKHVPWLACHDCITGHSSVSHSDWLGSSVKLLLWRSWPPFHAHLQAVFLVRFFTFSVLFLHYIKSRAISWNSPDYFVWHSRSPAYSTSKTRDMSRGGLPVFYQLILPQSRQGIFHDNRFTIYLVFRHKYFCVQSITALDFWYQDTL